MAPVYDIVILKRGEALGSRIHENLLTKGYPTQAAVAIDEALEALRTVSNPILLVDAGSDTERAYACAKEIIEKQALHSFPTIIIGAEVDGYEGVLGRYFKIIAALSTPCNTNDVLQGLAFIAKRLEAIRPPVEQEAPVDVEDSAPLIDREAPLPGDDNDDWERIPQMVFEEFERYHLVGRTLGGARYAYPINDREFEQLGLFPHHERAAKAAKQILQDMGKWGKNHLLRSTFLASKLAEPLGLSHDIVNQGTTSALLFSWSFGTKDRDLLRKDYLGSRSLLLRKDFCSKIKDSAMKVVVELSLSEVGHIIATMGKLVGREEKVSDTPAGLMASIVVTADLVDRVCFSSGAWNPHAAYSLLRKFKSGKVRELHPSSIACAIKLLSEAISANPRAAISRKNRENPELIAAAKAVADSEIGTHERKVELDHLTPGMRLSRPLLTFDGRKVLSDNLILDEDLIWRIW